MKIYLRLLSVCYAIGAALHLADVLDLRLPFSRMAPLWKAWIAGLLVADTIAAIGLWKQKQWGVALFVLIAVAQLLVYGPLCSHCERQRFLLYFHTLTLTLYAIFFARERLVRRRGRHGS